MTDKDKARLAELEAKEYLVEDEDVIDYYRLSCEKLEEENEKLKVENQELKARCKAIPPLVIKNEKLIKGIEVLKSLIILPMENDISMVDNTGHNYYILRYTRRLLNEKELELLNEVLKEYEKLD